MPPNDQTPCCMYKIALILVVLTDGFEFLISGSELCRYVGSTTVIRKSGSSVNGRSRISKIGNQKLRNLLFICSFNACKYNKACRDIYQRIVAKGKSKKLALIAVCNKLLKQAFAIAKSGLIYDDTYRSILVKKLISFYLFFTTVLCWAQVFYLFSANSIDCSQSA